MDCGREEPLVEAVGVPMVNKGKCFWGIVLWVCAIVCKVVEAKGWGMVLFGGGMDVSWSEVWPVGVVCISRI